MPLFSVRHNQAGALYVEAALVLPLLLLVTFAGAFFFLCAARHLSLQMAANEMAKDLSVALHDPRDNGQLWAEKTCIAGCKADPNVVYPWGGDREQNLLKFNVELDAYVNFMYTNAEGCWNACASSRYRLLTVGGGRTQYLSVRAQVFPVANWYDDDVTSNLNQASPGDYFMVTLSYPLRAVWGGGITFFGMAPDMSLVGTAVGVLEKRV
jgi:hypothetical protein